jgi:hypothetical protein
MFGIPSALHRDLCGGALDVGARLIVVDVVTMSFLWDVTWRAIKPRIVRR